ncbi:MAG: PSD1 and planctomycete cytochrome C domain-containing protein [Planctomycetota bacterium]|nr:PSD1 and planctomycete cytochrome C domain-containing protein [Planctomycetota bacterium]
MAIWPLVLASASNPTQISPDHAQRMEKSRVLFKQKVAGILQHRCVRCHGAQQAKGGLDLSTRAALMKGGDSGVVVKPGKAGQSLLVRLIRHDAQPAMPAEGRRLEAAALNAVVEWIDLGMAYSHSLNSEVEEDGGWTRRRIDDQSRRFWSFRPLQLQPLAATNDADSWSRNFIDRYVLFKAREQSLAMNPEADRRTLIRRVYLDLLGLPPSPAEVAAFVANSQPHAYEELLENLLASSHYGERWGRHWLDIVRFAESAGFEHDEDRPNAFHYRDFVVKALNADMPFDQFAQWQVAGDELAPDNPLALMATGFLGAGVLPTQLTEREFERARYDELDDMVATLGTSMLGLTVGCARCHDHKFDPIPSADYYRLVATFTTAIRSNVQVRMDAKRPPATVMVVSEGVKPIKHHADGRGFPHFYPQAYFLARGDPLQKQGVAPMGFLQVLVSDSQRAEHWSVKRPADAKSSYRRAGLSKWLTDVEHGAGHLLARVIVNRLWKHHFGRGLVATTNDFGVQGERPSHPELLDALSLELIRRGWRLKELHRLMMSTSTYRQSSVDDLQDRQRDPQNRWLWHFQPRRLEAEAIRDCILAVSGQLDRTSFGPGTLDQASRRRSIYFTIKRSKLIPMLQIFDAPEPLASTGERPATTIAPQALLFMNDPRIRNYALGFAQRLEENGDDSLDLIVSRAYSIALGRKATGTEVAAAQEFLTAQTKSYQEDSRTDAMLLSRADFCQILLSLNEFIYVD